MDKEKYRERVNVLKFTIGFTGVAIGFLVSLKSNTDLSFDISFFKLTIILWCTSLIMGIVAYILSYREVWYFGILPDKSLRKKILFPIEYVLVYIALVAHPVLIVIAVVCSLILFIGSR